MLRWELFLKLPNYRATFLFSIFHHTSDVTHLWHFQPRIANAHPATKIQIDTYMAALGFEKTTQDGCFRNSQYEVWDVLPRNVLVDDEGDIFVVDAEIKHITSSIT